MTDNLLIRACDPAKCTHGLVFDEAAATELLAGWSPKSDIEFLTGNPQAREVRKRWPRLQGNCPLGCGFTGIAYASMAHYTLGDW